MRLRYKIFGIYENPYGDTLYRVDEADTLENAKKLAERHLNDSRRAVPFGHMGIVEDAGEFGEFVAVVERGAHRLRSSGASNE